MNYILVYIAILFQYLPPFCWDSVIKTPRRTLVKALPVEPMFDTENSSNAIGGSKRALPYPLFKTLPFLTRDIPSPVKKS